MQSKNASGADNQQERLRFIGWIVGFVDGEGCFTVSIFKHPKSRLRLKWQVFPEFVITQEAKSEKSLEKVQKFFGCGGIYLNKRYDNHHEHLMKYVVRNREDLLTKIIPFFEEYALQTAKKNDFRIFARVVRKMERKEHLKERGLETIRSMVQKMNTRKYR
tara:strand:- start:198 stop:680 length:483 start_codon:yes stop_codon:yes gene_type:complete